MILTKDIIVDIDEVIAHIGPELERIFNEHTGLSISRHDWSDYSLSDTYPGVCQDTVRDKIIDEQVYENLEPIDGAVKSIERLRNMGYRVHFVTARGNHPNARNITAEWLMNWDFEYNSLSVVKHGERKSSAYNTIADKFAYIIDDHIDNLTDAVESNIVDTPIVITMPWNKHNTEYVQGNTRFNNLHEFCDMLQRTRII